jgi:hypothetical protein
MQHDAYIVCHILSAVPAAVVLVHHSFIPASPKYPEHAISICTLELYCHLQLCQASFGTELFAKVLCDLYGVSLVLLSYHVSSLQISSHTSAIIAPS